MATKIQIKRGTKANLPALSPGEFGLTTDTEELYIGGNSGNIRMGKNGESSTPNATATHSGSVVAITAPAGVNLISFYAPSDFSGDDTYTVNGSAVTLTDLNGNAVYDGWKEGAPVQLILKGTQAFFKSGGGVNDTLPPINPNMTGELADGVFTVTADKLPVAQADALAGAEWYYGDHVPARPGDGTKVEFTREQLITGAPESKAASEYNAGDIVKIKENGSPVEFICLKHGYPTLDNGMTLFCRKNIYSILDSITGISPDYDYTGSTLDTYMEATYKAVLSPYVRNIIQPVNIAVRTGEITRSIFPLSNGELGDTSDPVIGNAIPYFASDAQRISNYGSSPAQYATRLFNDYGVFSVCCVTKSGAFQRIAIGSLSNVGVRPAFVLPSSTLFSAYTNELIEDASGVQTLSGESIADEGSTVTLSIPWTESGYCYCRQFPYNSKHQYQTQLVEAVATNDPDYQDGSIPSEPEDVEGAYEFFQLITQTTQWSPSENGWYSIYCVGKSGNGANGSSGSRYGNGGPGGGSGGIARSTLYLRTTDVIEITINDSLTSFGDYMSATAGANADFNTRQDRLYVGGVGGNADGGNKANLPGYIGGSGGAASYSQKYATNGTQGGNEGGGGGAARGSSRYRGGGGGGGARCPVTPYTAAALNSLGYGGGAGQDYNDDGDRTPAVSGSVYPDINTNPPVLYGGGNGGGGGGSVSSSGSHHAGGTGSAGTPGCIIIEKATS